MHGWRCVEEWIPKHCEWIDGQRDDKGLSSQVDMDVLGTQMEGSGCVEGQGQGRTWA